MSLQTPPPPAAQKLESCAGCGGPLSPDQRYCLSCGRRRGQPRIEYDRYLGDGVGPIPGQPDASAANGATAAMVPARDEGVPPGGVPPVRPIDATPPADDRPEREVTPLMAAAGLTMVALILLVGVLLGKSASGGGQAPQPVIAAAPAATPGTTTTASTTTVEVALDWPAGKEGFTIELATLSKDGTDGTAVEAAKTELAAKGAAEVGVLDSDEYGSLPGGSYVLYSGVYDTEKQAKQALGELQADFPDAQVVEVAADASTASADDGGGADEAVDPAVAKESEEAIESIDEATGAEYEELQKKLPPEIATPGEAPPKDNKPPGGGTGDAVEIG